MYLSVTNSYSSIFVTELNPDKTLTFNEIKQTPLEIFTDGYNETGYTSLIGNKPLNRIEFDSVNKYQTFKKDNSKIDNMNLYNVIEPCYQYIRQQYPTPDFSTKPRYWYLDIETDLDDGKFSSPKTANAPITLIQIAESDTRLKFIFGWMQDYTTDRDDVKYFYFEDEETMLNAFIQFHAMRQPGITTAWFGDNFDFPYITTRLSKFGIKPEILSPFNEMEQHTTVIFGQKDTIPKPVGLYWVDTVEVYKRLTPGGREAWTLDFIAGYEKIEGKLHWQDEGFKTFSDFLKGKYSSDCDIVKGKLWELSQQPQTPHRDAEMRKVAYYIFVDYGIRDVEVLLEMDRKKKMLDVLVTLAWTMKCNLYDVFGTIKPWAVFLYNDARDINKAMPQRTAMQDREYGGGYVYADQGVYKWIIVEDYASLYPNIIMQKGLSPESYVPENEIPRDLWNLIQASGIYRAVNCDEIYIGLAANVKEEIRKLLVKYNLTMGVNGTCYRKDVNGILPQKISMIYNERKFHKKEMLKASAVIELLKIELEARGEKI